MLLLLSALPSFGQSIAGYNLVDCIDSVIGPCPSVEYVKGYPNDSTWVNFNPNYSVTLYFNQGWVAHLGDEIIFETSFHPDNCIIELILANNILSNQHLVDTTDWTALPDVYWKFRYTNNCYLGGVTLSGRHYLPLDFTTDFGLSTTDHVIGAKITMLSTVGYPDVAGVYITENAFPAPDCNPPQLSDTIICSGNTLEFDAGIDVPNANFLWNTGDTDSILTITQGGTYTVSITSTYCVFNDTIIIDSIGNIAFDLGVDTLLCGDSIFNISSGLNNNYDFLWSTNQITSNITVDSTGIYWLTAADSLCNKTDSIHITFQDQPMTNLGNDTTFCDELIGYLYNQYVNQGSNTWSDGSSADTLAVELPGVYWLTVTNGNCTATNSIAVNFADYPPIDLGSDTSICPGDFISYDFTNMAQNIMWSDGTSDFTNAFYTDQQIWVSAANESCAVQDSINLWITAPIEYNLPPYQEVCFDDHLTLEVEAEDVDIQWQDGSTTPSFEVQTAGTYTVILSNLCETINVSTDILFIDCQCPLYVPNSFTPDGNDINNSFQPKTNCNLNNYTLTIFNRYGEILFQSHDFNASWDGTYKGQACKTDTYTYTLEYTNTVTNKKEFKTGHVLLLR